MCYEFANLVADLFGKSAPSDPAAMLDLFEKVGERKGRAIPAYHFMNSEKEGRTFVFPLTAKEVRGQGVHNLSE